MEFYNNEPINEVSKKVSDFIESLKDLIRELMVTFKLDPEENIILFSNRQILDEMLLSRENSSNDDKYIYAVQLSLYNIASDKIDISDFYKLQEIFQDLLFDVDPDSLTEKCDFTNFEGKLLFFLDLIFYFDYISPKS